MSSAIDRLDALAYAAAHEQARALAAGETSASALLEHLLARIERHNPRLNAIIARDDAAARAAARAADAALARGERKPLLGVPVTVKENFNVAGLITSVGDPAHAGNRATQDAPAVAALREAGAVLIGKTNVPLALADLQSYNDIYGATLNPWDETRTPGGSSGGAAAAVAAGLTGLELGTDIGGSIRIPAHFTGVFGHKPTVGLVHNGGTGVPAGRQTLRDLAVAGPLARSAQDLELALQVLLNRDPLASKAWRAQLPASRHERLRDFTVLLLAQWPGQEASRSELRVHARLLDILQAAGARVLRPADLPSGLLPDLNAAHVLYRSLLGASLPPRPSLPEGVTIDGLRNLGDEDDPDAAWLRAPYLSHHEWLQKHEARLQLRNRWEAFFGAVDLVLTPVLATTAFRHDHSPKDARRTPVEYPSGTRSLRFAELFNWAGLPVLPGLPATSFPLGIDEDGLPYGAQAVGPYLEDLTPIRFAHLLERAGAIGFQAPSGLD
ncbi:amidase [Bordetella genomosp. 10]|uniref:Amidase n=2 Tax=Bordetella genomosp. 10 TaxID=1416804 RepID=A0A261SLD0_9BORD|nr:amidase [Bordetella genomosp. 10]